MRTRDHSLVCSTVSARTVSVLVPLMSIVITFNAAGGAARNPATRATMPINLAEFERHPFPGRRRCYRCVQCGTANVTGVQTACHSRSPTNPGRRSPPRHRHYPHKRPTHRGFVQSGFCEVALTSPLPVPVVPATSQNPQDSRIDRGMISIWQIEEVCHGHAVQTDYTAGQIRRLAQRAKDAAQARRLLAIAAVLDGASREEAAKIGGGE